MSSHELTICDQCGSVEKKANSFLGVHDWTIPGVIPFKERCTDFCSWECLRDYVNSKLS